MRGRPVPRILIDNCVLRHGLTHSNAWISTGTVLWGCEVPVETHHTARVPRNYEAGHQDIYEIEVPYFASLSRLAIDRRILLFTSRELLRERYRQPGYNRFRFGMNLWSKAPIEMLPDLSRSQSVSCLLGPNQLRDHWSKNEQVRRLRATADSDFLKLTKSIPDAHILDLYHLWTAKYTDCSIFLTTDGRFRRFFENNLKRSICENFCSVRIMAPSELGRELGLAPIPHDLLTPLDSDWFYELRSAQIIEKQQELR